MSEPTPPPLPVAPKALIRPTTDVPHHPSCDCPLHLAPYQGEPDPPVPPSARPTSLDIQESSVRRDFDKWMAEKGGKEEYFYDIALDTSSLSARFRHSGWAPIRKRIWEALIRTGQNPSRRRGFGECGSYSWIEQSTSNSNRFRIRYNHCHDRLCTPCANARSVKIQEALMNQIAGQPVSFITLTLCGKNEPLSELIDRLYKGFRALRLHPVWEEKVKGGAAFLEIKYNDKARRWHPHLHIIADAKYIDQGELSDIWRGITKDSFIVDIRRVRQAEVTARYVTKYASKPLNTSFTNTPALLDEAIIAFKGRRLCLCFGSWYGTSLTDAEDATLEEDIDEEKWVMFSDLETIIGRAESGDRQAREVLVTAGGEVRYRQMLMNPP